MKCLVGSQYPIRAAHPVLVERRKTIENLTSAASANPDHRLGHIRQGHRRADGGRLGLPVRKPCRRDDQDRRLGDRSSLHALAQPGKERRAPAAFCRGPCRRRAGPPADPAANTSATTLCLLPDATSERSPACVAERLWSPTVERNHRLYSTSFIGENDEVFNRRGLRSPPCFVDARPHGCALIDQFGQRLPCFQPSPARQLEQLACRAQTTAGSPRPIASSTCMRSVSACSPSRSRLWVPTTRPPGASRPAGASGPNQSVPTHAVSERHAASNTQPRHTIDRPASQRIHSRPGRRGVDQAASRLNEEPRGVRPSSARFTDAVADCRRRTSLKARS